MLGCGQVFKTMAENAQEVRELYVMDNIPNVDGIPSPLNFHRDFVAKNIPCIFTNCINAWPAIKKWSVDYLRHTIGNKLVSVAVTPNGYSDAIANNMFMLPHEVKMSVDEVLSHMCNLDTEHDAVYYIQKQNSNLLTEFPELVEDVAEHLAWATDTFGKHPDAVNFWMGNSAAVTSLHKDHYENLYCVIRGKKTFTLYPPTDRPYIPYKQYRVGKYTYNKSKWEVVGTDDSIPWIPVDPLKPDFGTYPQFKLAKPITCEIKPGEILYLPALWFHHVQQSDETIAVNYWYDMDFDMKFTYYQLMNNLATLLEGSSAEYSFDD